MASGHIARLAQVGRPDVGIVTSVAMAHVEYFGDLDGVARAKSELVTGAAPIGRRRPELRRSPGGRAWRRSARARCWATRSSADAEVRAEARRRSMTTYGRGSRWSTPWGRGEVRLALHGLQQVPNALARRPRRCGVACPSRPWWRRWPTATGSPFRMEVHRIPGGPLLVVDCYNANPASTEAALRSLAALRPASGSWPCSG